MFLFLGKNAYACFFRILFWENEFCLATIRGYAFFGAYGFGRTHFLILGGFMRKILSLLLVGLMLCYLGISLTSCGKKKDENGVIYKMNDDKDEYIVVGYKGNHSTVVIPEEFKGYPVTEIGNQAFELCEQIEKISLPDSIKKIGDSAFSMCKNLKKVIIPDSVTSIGEGAFRYCDYLEYVLIGDSVEVIGEAAFMGCGSLESVVIPVSVKKIGRSSFLSMLDSSLSIYYMGTEDDWNKINIHEEDSTLKYVPIYYYSLTKPLVKGNFWHYVNGATPTIWN